jgi:hypothetical protein
VQEAAIEAVMRQLSLIDVMGLVNMVCGAGKEEKQEMMAVMKSVIESAAGKWKLW